jgi:hypothetical protein
MACINEVDGRPVGEREIRTQPGRFSLAGGGVTAGCDRAGPVTTDYAGGRPWAFTGGRIRRVIVDLGGEPYRDPEWEAVAMLLRE